MLREPKETMTKEEKETRRTLLQQIENTSKEIEVIKRNQREFLELRSITAEMKETHYRVSTADLSRQTKEADIHRTL